MSKFFRKLGSKDHEEPGPSQTQQIKELQRQLLSTMADFDREMKSLVAENAQLKRALEESQRYASKVSAEKVRLHNALNAIEVADASGKAAALRTVVSAMHSTRADITRLCDEHVPRILDQIPDDTTTAEVSLCSAAVKRIFGERITNIVSISRSSPIRVAPVGIIFLSILITNYCAMELLPYSRKPSEVAQPPRYPESSASELHSGLLKKLESFFKLLRWSFADAEHRREFENDVRAICTSWKHLQMTIGRASSSEEKLEVTAVGGLVSYHPRYMTYAGLVYDGFKDGERPPGYGTEDDMVTTMWIGLWKTAVLGERWMWPDLGQAVEGHQLVRTPVVSIAQIEALVEKARCEAPVQPQKLLDAAQLDGRD